ncbi:methyltransferase domain-containing protein [Sulfurimonas lithotrophica]|uniref:Methyltransferase domain-containing protein n=1 Tax=Sulfurimonas lithotrophica TaxID=2590022 RepID=A0A5P8NY64_9BACT|nr:methyltransferase domain-containing protein [Sulfurimonas lithotrophica]QFR48350.1 methyltransferase domain-containing protein [Sulfurimonas lithotrophica]
MMSFDKDFFSDSVHKYIAYKDIDKTLEKYEKRILNELKLRGYGPEFLKDKIIIDIGTGFQAIIACLMGAKFIYHLDISTKQVSWMKDYCTLNNIENIKSIECDITKKIDVAEKVDIVFVFGILNHLEKPSRFMNNLIPVLNLNKSHILFRIYRSGSWSRWLVSYLREISNKIDHDIIENRFKIMYQNDQYNQYYGDLMDDLYAPIWKVFHPRQFDINNITKMIDKEDWDYNFSSRDENFRVDINVNKKNIQHLRNFKFPDVGIEQNRLSVGNNNAKLLKIHNLFEKWNLMDELPLDNADRLLKIYELVRKKSVNDIESKFNLDKEERIDLLLNILESFVEDI